MKYFSFIILVTGMIFIAFEFLSKSEVEQSGELIGDELLSDSTTNESLETTNRRAKLKRPNVPSDSIKQSVVKSNQYEVDPIESSLLNDNDLDGHALNSLMMGDGYFDTASSLQSTDEAPENWNDSVLRDYLESSEAFQKGDFYTNQFNCGAKICLGSFSYFDEEAKNRLQELLASKSKFILVVNYSQKEGEQEIRVAISHLPLSITM